MITNVGLVMKDIKKFKNRIFFFGILAMLLMEIISLPFLGFNIKFLYGLLLGTAIAIVNFSILVITMSRILNGSNKFAATISYIFRLLIYGGVFLVAINTGNMAGLGCVLGFLTIKLSIYFVYGLKPGFKWVKEKRGRGVLHKKHYILIRDPYRVTYAAGKTISTHRRLEDYKRKEHA